MLLEIKKSIEVKEEVEVQLPFYYKSSYWADYPNPSSETFGRVTETSVTTIEIQEGQGNDSKKFIIESEPLEGMKDISYEISSYLEPRYAATEAEFLDALEQAKKHLNTL
jgi:hypothetical protein